MTFKRILGIFIFLLFTTSCFHAHRHALPAGLARDSIIDKETMVHLLADIHIQEAALQVMQNRNPNIRKEIVSSYNGLFSKYGVSAKRFRLNLDYYRYDGDEFVKMYENVVKEIESRKNSLKP
ncbi:MAG: DUF4296 domain-containing protein [Bacteroidota bacterium]|nr:DUF4296 domain-containing protein [Bacteroidota bacterium]